MAVFLVLGSVLAAFPGPGLFAFGAGPGALGPVGDRLRLRLRSVGASLPSAPIAVWRVWWRPTDTISGTEKEAAGSGDRGKRRNGPSGVSRDHEHAANAMSPWGAGVS